MAFNLSIAKYIRTRVLQGVAAAALALAAMPATAAFDHELALDQNGIWARKYQIGLEYGVIAADIAGSLWLGSDDPVGQTFFQSFDAMAISSISAEALKLTFSRARPDQGDDPHRWFQGRCCDSFPSGEVTLQASFVTPFIVDYARDRPWVWALELLPLYDAVARLKSQEHWQSDVIAGWAIGTAVGYWTTTWHTPLSVELLPRGLTIGFRQRF